MPSAGRSNPVAKTKDLRRLLQQYGVSFRRPGIYEFSSIALPWFSSESKANIEIELLKEDEQGDYVFHLLLVPDLEGIVERTIMLASTLDAEGQPKEMFVAKSVRENIIPDITGLEYSAKHNAYSIRDPNVFILTVQRLFAQLPKKEPSYLGKA